MAAQTDAGAAATVAPTSPHHPVLELVSAGNGPASHEGIIDTTSGGGANNPLDTPTEAAPKPSPGRCAHFSARSQRFCRGKPLEGLPMCGMHMQKQSQALVDGHCDTARGVDGAGLPVSPPRNPNPAHCSFFVKRKERFCRMMVGGGRVFCGEHAAVGDNGGGGAAGGASSSKSMGPGPVGAERIPCPLDPRHTVYKHRLVRHLKKCTGRPDPLPEYHTECHNSTRNPSDAPGPKISLADLTTVELRALIQRVRAAGDKHMPEIVESVLDHPVVRAEIDKCKPSGEKYNNIGVCSHLEQQASLIGNMESCGLLRERQCYIEFGAGRGKLLHFVYRAVGPDTEADFLAVDRMRTRCKFDRFHRVKTPSSQLPDPNRGSLGSR
jgi:hypothetical protein